MMKLILPFIILISFGCGGDGGDGAPAKEITPKQDNKTETIEECSWVEKCKEVKVRSKSKRGRSCTETSCKWVWVCKKEENIPVSL
jgi:hypothetical protein